MLTLFQAHFEHNSIHCIRYTLSTTINTASSTLECNNIHCIRHILITTTFTVSDTLWLQQDTLYNAHFEYNNIHCIGYTFSTTTYTLSSTPWVHQLTLYPAHIEYNINSIRHTLNTTTNCISQTLSTTAYTGSGTLWIHILCDVEFSEQYLCPCESFLIHIMVQKLKCLNSTHISSNLFTIFYCFVTLIKTAYYIDQ